MAGIFSFVCFRRALIGMLDMHHCFWGKEEVVVMWLFLDLIFAAALGSHSLHYSFGVVTRLEIKLHRIRDDWEGRGALLPVLSV